MSWSHSCMAVWRIWHTSSSVQWSLPNTQATTCDPPRQNDITKKIIPMHVLSWQKLFLAHDDNIKNSLFSESVFSNVPESINLFLHILHQKRRQNKTWQRAKRTTWWSLALKAKPMFMRGVLPDLGKGNHRDQGHSKADTTVQGYFLSHAGSDIRTHPSPNAVYTSIFPVVEINSFAFLWQGHFE